MSNHEKAPLPRVMSTVEAPRIVGSGGGRANTDVGSKSCASRHNQGNCCESRQRYECPARCCLTLRSRRGPTAGRQGPAGGTRYIFASPGLASCRWSRLSSNVRPRIHESGGASHSEPLLAQRLGAVGRGRDRKCKYRGEIRSAHVLGRLRGWLVVCKQPRTRMRIVAPRWRVIRNTAVAERA